MVSEYEEEQGGGGDRAFEKGEQTSHVHRDMQKTGDFKNRTIGHYARTPKKGIVKRVFTKDYDFSFPFDTSSWILIK